MKWIVTGACGFIGTNFIEHLLARGDEVVGVDNVSRPRVHHNLAFLRDQLGTQVAVGDIRDKDFMSRIFIANDDAGAVAHLAGQVSYLAGEDDPLDDFEINALGTAIVCSAASRYLDRVPLIFSSTNKVYGDLARPRLIEGPTRYMLPDYPGGISDHQEVCPIGAYASSKACAEMTVRSWTQRGGIRGVSLRQSSIYGGRQFPTADQGWVAYFAEAFSSDREYTVSGSGKQVRDLLHVHDLCNAYSLAAENSSALVGQAWNIGGGAENSLSILELSSWLESATGNSPAMRFLAERPNDQRVFISENRGVREVLGWRPQTAIEEGLQHVLLWSQELQTLGKSAVNE